MRIEIAKPSDDAELKSFFESFHLLGPINLRVQRPQSYFNYYRLQSEDFETYILRDSKNKIQGCGTLIFREGFLLGKYQKIGYATDLRISQNRAAIIGWARHFMPTIKSACKKRNTEYLFSILSENDLSIYNTLIRPRARRRNLPIYTLLRKFDIVTLFGHFPLYYHKLNSIKINRGDSADIEALADYLRKKSAKHPLAFSYSPELLHKRFQSWPGLRIDSFLIAKDKRGQIVGCTAPWSTSSVQRLFAEKYEGFAESTRTALKIGSWFGLSSKLPPTTEEIQTEFLTHLHADNADIFAVLLEHAYAERAPNAVLVYPHFHSYPKTLPPKVFFHSTSKASLYMFKPSQEDIPQELLHAPMEYPPELELCLI